MMKDNKFARVVLLANSQGTSAGINWKDAYPAVLAELLKYDIELHRLLMSGWTIRDFLDVIEDNVIGLRPDLVVIQIGIVECARRILTERHKALFRLIPFGYKVTKYLHYHRAVVLKIRNWLGINTRLIDPLEFEILISRTVKLLEENCVPYIFVPIPFITDNGLNLKHPMINKDIKEYNKILHNYVSIPIDTELMQPHTTMFQNESVHFTVDGHKFFASFLAKAIVSKLKGHNLDLLSILE